MRRRVLLLAVLGAAVTAPQSAMGAQSLTGEIGFAGTSDPTFVNVQCNRTGVSTFTYSGTGEITQGPYLGTLTVSGSGSFGPQDIPTNEQAPYFTLDAGPLLTFHETFRIDSPSSGTTVTGEKNGVLANPPSAFVGDARPAVCGEFTDTPLGSGRTVFVETYTNYDAQISAPDGVWRDQGFAFVEATNFFAFSGGSDIEGDGLSQFWQSTSFARAAPTTKADCKNGGWQNYPELGFKNQGDCVSYVATGGKNPPAGS